METTVRDSKFQPTSIGAGSLLTLGYSYALNGNVTGQTITAGSWSATQSYGYDGVNRLCLAQEGGTGGMQQCSQPTGTWYEQYGHDPYGNRWVSANTGINLSLLTPRSIDYYYAATNRMNTVVTGYDGAGNIQQLPTGSMTYDGENRITTANFGGTTAVYDYDGEGRRVRKQLTGNNQTATTIYVYDAFGHLAAEYGAATAFSTCVTCYFTADSLGSTRLVTDGTTGAAVARYDYLPFGEEVEVSSTNDPGGRREVLCGVPSCYPQMSPTDQRVTQKFTGKERDAETGLDYFGARYFSGPEGRFTGWLGQNRS